MEEWLATSPPPTVSQDVEIEHTRYKRPNPFPSPIFDLQIKMENGVPPYLHYHHNSRSEGSANELSSVQSSANEIQ